MTTNKTNLAIVLEDAYRVYPDKTAIIFRDTKLTYTQLNGAVNKIANGLTSMGLGKGDKIALSCLNLPYFPMVYYAILKIGAVVVPLNVLLKRKEIAYHLEDSDAKAYFSFIGTEDLPMAQEAYAGFSQVDSCQHLWIITPEGMGSPIEGIPTMADLMQDQSPVFLSVATENNDPAVILYTSGTTGRPKGAQLSHFNMYTNAAMTNQLFESTNRDIHLITLPLFHSFGQTTQMNAGIMSGCSLVIIPKFDPDVVLSAMQEHGVTLFAGVPTMYWAILNHPGTDKYDLDKISSNLRLGASGGSAMPVAVMEGVEKKFNITILEGYGLSETSPVASFSRLGVEKIPGSIGLPAPGIELSIMDQEGNELGPEEVGEICIRGHNIMIGYYNKPEATDEAFRGGWFHSGDLGKRDEKGYYYVVDRLKDMILRGGYNVYPREVEEMMMDHPAISLVAVVGVPDDEYGEEIEAHVVLKEGQQATPEQIRDWCKQEMAAYKYPRRVYIKDELPMNATGKILKRVLRKQ